MQIVAGLMINLWTIIREHDLHKIKQPLAVMVAPALDPSITRKTQGT